MTKTIMDHSELLATLDGGDLLRTLAEAVLQRIMGTAVDSPVSTEKHERA